MGSCGCTWVCPTQHVLAVAQGSQGDLASLAKPPREGQQCQAAPGRASTQPRVASPCCHCSRASGAVLRAQPHTPHGQEEGMSCSQR